MFKKYILLCFMFFTITSTVSAIEEPTLDTIKPELVKPELPNLEKPLVKPELSNKEIFEESFQASNKFAQSNIQAASDDFKVIIEKIKPNDFVYLDLSDKLAEFGLFNLSHIANKKTLDPQISNNHVINIEKYYYPKQKLNTEEESALAEIYSNITFNNQSKETLNDMLKNEEKYNNNDYANYLTALCAYKSSDNKTALKYIRKAILLNPSNINYKLLYTEILTANRNSKEALEIINQLKSEKIADSKINLKINATEQYILYKKSKQNWKKDYHLSYYYFYQKEYAKAIKNLQLGLGKNKFANAKLQGLMSKVYIATENYDKAQEAADKAYKINKNDCDTLISLGDLNDRNNDWKSALKYYKKASKKESFNYESNLKLATSYKKINKTEKADKIYSNILKQYPNAYEIYYQKALAEPKIADIYLKKSLSINLFYADAWFELAKFEINAKNYDTAKQYLQNANFIKSDDLRYETYLKSVPELNEK